VRLMANTVKTQNWKRIPEGRIAESFGGWPVSVPYRVNDLLILRGILSPHAVAISSHTSREYMIIT